MFIITRFETRVAVKRTLLDKLSPALLILGGVFLVSL